MSFDRFTAVGARVVVARRGLRTPDDGRRTPLDENRDLREGAPRWRSPGGGQAARVSARLRLLELELGLVGERVLVDVLAHLVVADAGVLPLHPVVGEREAVDALLEVLDGEVVHGPVVRALRLEILELAADLALRHERGVARVLRLRELLLEARDGALVVVELLVEGVARGLELQRALLEGRLVLERAPQPVSKSNLQPDFNVRV